MRRLVAHCGGALPLLWPLQPHFEQITAQFTMFFFFFRSSSSSARNFHLRKARKWPLSPYKAKWQETFTHQQAFRTLKQSSQASPHLLSTLINSFSIYHCDPSPNAYHFIIKTLAQTSKLDQIPEILDHIEHVEKFETPEFVFVDLIRIYGDSNMIKDAVDLFFSIPRFRCVPSVDSLNCLISVLCRDREGIRFVSQILLKSRLMNIRVEESCFFLLIEGLCRIKKLNYAIKLLGFMISEGYGLDGRMCSLILSALCEGEEDCVMGFLDDMRKLGFVPKMVDWRNVIRFLVKRGRGMDALDALQQMKMGGVKPDAVCYTLVLDGVIAEGKFENFDKLFDEMLVLGLVPDIHTYNAYIKGLCRQNKVEEGITMLADMEELGCKPDVVTYNVLLQGFCQAGKLSKAMELKEMGVKGMQLYSCTYGILISGMVKEGEIDEACSLLKEVLDKGLTLQSATFDEIICGFCKKGLVSKALELLKELVGKNVAPGTRAWEALLLGSELKCNFEETISMETKISIQTKILGIQTKILGLPLFLV